MLNVVKMFSHERENSQKLQSGIAGSSFCAALSPDAYAEKDALISVTASSNSDASGPAFLNYAKEHQAQKISEPVKPVEEKSNNTKTTNKKTVLNTHEVSRQAAIIAQKDKLIRQLQQQLDAKPATMNAEAGNQKELKNKIQLLEKKLATAVAEKQQLIDNALSAAAEIKQIEGQRNATENKTLQQEKRVVLLESAKQKVERQLAEATAEKQSLQQKLAALETEKQDKLAAAAAEKLALTGKFTTEAKERQALATRLAAAEAAQQEMLTKLTAADAAQRALQTKLDASQTEQKAAIAKLAAVKRKKQI